MNSPHQNNTLYKLDASFSEVHGSRLEFTGGAVKSREKPLQAASFPSPCQGIRLVAASEAPLPPTPPPESKVKGPVRFANEIKVDYLFYPNQSVDQPVRMRREIYDDDEGVLLYYLEICEEGLEKMWNIPHKTVRCQINGKKGMIERLNKEKQHHEELELAGYGYSGGTGAEEKDMSRAAPINSRMKDRAARLMEELKEEQLLDLAELEITRKTAENTKINAGAVKTAEELREPRMSNERRNFVPSSIIPPQHDTLENTQGQKPTGGQRERVSVAQPSEGNPGDPLRMPADDVRKTNTESDMIKQRYTPKSTKSGIGTEKPLRWDEYLKDTGKRSTAAHEKRRVLRGGCFNRLRPFFLGQKIDRSAPPAKPTE